MYILIYVYHQSFEIDILLLFLKRRSFSPPFLYNNCLSKEKGLNLFLIYLLFCFSSVQVSRYLYIRIYGHHLFNLYNYIFSNFYFIALKGVACILRLRRLNFSSPLLSQSYRFRLFLENNIYIFMYIHSISLCIFGFIQAKAALFY